MVVLFALQCGNLKTNRESLNKFILKLAVTELGSSVVL